MKVFDIRDLCLRLIRAEAEEEVVSLLSASGFWENAPAWRFYDDNENNYATIGAQMSKEDAALVEKLVNAVDARLINECAVRGIDPEGEGAPRSIRSAVAQFFEEHPTAPTAGLISEWPDSKRTEQGRLITLAATGAMARAGYPCLTIADAGEGQMPRSMPTTFLSLTKRSNKLRIPFVQGKFNMGGTGVLRFGAGRHKLQLILSRRNPALIKSGAAQPTDFSWGFTVVRREDPKAGRRNSAYTYLAPVGCDSSPRAGEVLTFDADELPIFPDGQEPYTRLSSWGTLIKLYEYGLKGKSNILMKDGVLRRLDLLLPSPALPIRLYECRKGFRGKAGSWENNATGIQVRLEDEHQNLEAEFPASFSMKIAGEQLTGKIYAFKKDKAETYRKNEGVIFSINGQTHGHLTTDFFRRNRVGMSYLSSSLLVALDCSQFSGRSREDLFMNSRDRLSDGPLKRKIEKALEDELRNNQLLRDLRERRRREVLAEKTKDSKPLVQVLEAIIRKYPTLSRLFVEGKRLSTPFKTHKVRSKLKKFKGKRYPTFFKLKGVKKGVELRRRCHINMRCRINFETDACNDYFDRSIDPGVSTVFISDHGELLEVTDYTLNLQNGIATLNLQLPPTTGEGDEVRMVCEVTDNSRVEPFENWFTIAVGPPGKARGGQGKRRSAPSGKRGREREAPSQLSLPPIAEVTEKQWSDQSPRFDQYTALRIRNAGDEGSDSDKKVRVYDFFVNMDNIYLKTELKGTKVEPEIVRERFKVGLVLVGLAMIQHRMMEPKTAEDMGTRDDANGDIEVEVETVTKGIAAVLLPMIDSLGGLKLEEELAAAADFSAEAL